LGWWNLKITTLETSIAVPFEFGAASAKLDDVAPDGVRHHAQQGKLWHLVAWVDEVRSEAGFCHKGRCITIPWPADRAVIGELRPAKGPGCISFAVSARQGSIISVFYSSKHSELLLTWLEANRGRLSEVCGCGVESEIWGLDY